MAVLAINGLTLLVIVGVATAVQQHFLQRPSRFQFLQANYNYQPRHRSIKDEQPSNTGSPGSVIQDIDLSTGMYEDIEVVSQQGDVERLLGLPGTTHDSSTAMPLSTEALKKPGGSNNGCWPEYELLPGVGCYKVVKEDMPWKNALHTCRADCVHPPQCARLAVPESQSEIDFFIKLSHRPDNYYPWMGINKTGEHWTSVQGSVFDNSSFWETGEPEYQHGDCVVVGPKGLENIPCITSQPFICRQP